MLVTEPLTDRTHHYSSLSTPLVPGQQLLGYTRSFGPGLRLTGLERGGQKKSPTNTVIGLAFKVNSPNILLLLEISNLCYISLSFLRKCHKTSEHKPPSSGALSPHYGGYSKRHSKTSIQPQTGWTDRLTDIDRERVSWSIS